MINPVKNISYNLSTCSLVLLALLPVLPLFVPLHLNPVRSFHNEWLAIILGLLAWLVIFPLLWQQQNLLIPRLALLPLALMAFIGVQAQLLPLVIIQHAQMGMLYLLWAALLMVLVKLLVAQTNQHYVSQWIAIGLSAAAVSASVIDFIFRLKGVSGWWGGTAQPNNYGDLLALGLASVLYLLAINKPVWRACLLTAVSVIILGLSLTPSRSVWLYWIAMLVIAIVLQRGMVKWLITGLGLYLLLQVLWTLHPLPTDQLSGTAAEKLYQSVGGTSIRLHIWQAAWQLFIDSPWLGQGFGQFDWGYFQAGQHISELPNRLEHAHNLILHFLAELGLFPALVLLGLLGVWFKDLMTAITKKRLENNNSSLTFYVWLLMLLAILGIHSLLEYPLWYAQFLGVAAIILALGETKHWQLRLKPAFSLAVSVLIMVGITIASVHEWHYFKIEQAAENYHSKNADRLTLICRKAAAQAPLLTPYVALVFSVGGELSNQEMRPSLTLLNNASYHFVPSAPLSYQQSALQALNGFKNEAQQTMKLALLAYPNYAKDFVDSLRVLNAEDRKKTEVLRKTAENSLKQRI